MQHLITVPSRLLNSHGELIQKGYATSPILDYQRRDVARKLRLKEWDYYLVYNKNDAIAVTVGKSNAFLLISVTFIDLLNRIEKTKSAVRIVPNHKLTLPESSDIGNIVYQDNSIHVAFFHRGNLREIYLNMKAFDHDKDLEVFMRLFNEPRDSMVISTPFKEDRKAFYYNNKIIGMNASGTIHYNNRTISFTPEDSFGLLDWGRGVWPYRTTWYWGAASGMVNGDLFGFNLGYGFGDTSAATENMLFFNGEASKLDDITFHIPRDEYGNFDYLSPWKVTSSDLRFEMNFEPILDRSVSLNAVILSTNQHQIFGKFSGYAILDDGTIIIVNDFLGFAERVVNKW